MGVEGFGFLGFGFWFFLRWRVWMCVCFNNAGVFIADLKAFAYGLWTFVI